MDSIKWKCKNWIFYFRKLDNFHKLDLINFHPNFFYSYHYFYTHVRDLNTFFKKNIRGGNIIEQKDKMLKDF